ncbi:MAG: hypothetical protein VX549_05580 [Pseudomonadota bacterium]|nr:hypothetical protein [Pseudomonadota bacterium]
MTLKQLGLGALSLILLAGCASVELKEGERDMVGPTLYTKTNLHPDEAARRLYAVNYQQAGLIPVCTAVTVKDVDGDAMVFTVNETNREYTYIYHKAAAEPFPDHIKRFFGFSCPEDEIGNLSAIDQKGIRSGKALKGMSKRGVIIAIGLPPRHVTPDPQRMDQWTYWSNRFNRFLVTFDETGHVTGIQD